MKLNKKMMTLALAESIVLTTISPTESAVLTTFASAIVPAPAYAVIPVATVIAAAILATTNFFLNIIYSPFGVSPLTFFFHSI